MEREALGRGQRFLGEVGQFQIVEEEVEVLLLGEDEAELVLAFPVFRALGAAAPATASR